MRIPMTGMFGDPGPNYRVTLTVDRRELRRLERLLMGAGAFGLWQQMTVEEERREPTPIRHEQLGTNSLRVIPVATSITGGGPCDAGSGSDASGGAVPV